MERLSYILVIAAVAACPVIAETPQAVNEISIVGPQACSGSTVGLRCSDLTNFPYVYVNGFYAPSDGG
jgi:hypothetical protein